LRSLFSGRRLDLAVAVAAPAANFFLQFRSELFPNTPLLIVGADARTFNNGTLSANDATVPVVMDQALPILNILQLLPDTRRIAVVLGDSPLERFWVEALHRDYEGFANRINFDWFNKLPFDG